jgi:ankyrin repeat protein
MAEKCLQIDPCFIIYGPTYENFELMDRYFNEFVVMAKIKDENGLTPFQIACENIRKHIRTNEQLPSQVTRFMKFLYKNCKSNPNEQMLDETPSDEAIKSTNQPVKNGMSRDEKQPTVSSKSFTTPIFKLISDKCVDLVHDLYRLMKENENLVKIDFNFMNSDGLTPLLAAIVTKQTKLAQKLVDLGIFDPKKLKQQVSTNEEVYHKMNILQMAITYEQPTIFRKLVDVFCSSTHSMSDFVELLTHQDANRRNLLHTFSLKKSELFDLKLLRNFKQKVDKYLLNSEHKNVLGKLLESRDKHGRNPLHLSLMHGHASLKNAQYIDLELFFIEHLKLSSHSGDNHQSVFNDKDKFARLPLHYLFHKASKSEVDKEVDPSKSQLELNAAELNVIDPVELLTLLIKNTRKEMLDDKDVYGFTALHYAAVRGATISCSMLISSGADYTILTITPLQFFGIRYLKINRVFICIQVK